MVANQCSEPEIPVDTLVVFMRGVLRCESALRELNLMWRLIESSAKMNCPQEARALLPMLQTTREGLQRLEVDLVQSLVAQSLREVLTDLRTSAHHVIDIVVRSLYERTADVGFLATDAQLCAYVAGLSDGQGVQQRLWEYRQKYSVYDEILLIDHQGAVLAQVDEHSPVEGSDDPLIAATLQRKAYLETFRATDLRPGKAQALLYTHRMLHPHTHQSVGVLALGFDLEGEMHGLFESWCEQPARSIAVLLDADRRVLASSDEHWIGKGERVPVNLTGAAVPCVHAGRTYLVQTVAARPYQGYPGPAGWMGQVMIPIDQAFGTKARRAIDALEPAVAQGLLAHAHRFCPPLHAVVAATDTIRRVVWNGQVMTASQGTTTPQLKAVLEQIGETGAHTHGTFAHAIRDLYDTVLSASLRESEQLTQLLVDVLDRNLYERANDCRWWALTPQLCDLLAREAQGQDCTAEREQACALLEHLNRLYTVYARIVVYDRQGTIVAASRSTLAHGLSVLGMGIEPDTLDAVLHLSDTQSYHVSPWRSGAYGCPADEPGYVYHAAIRSPQDATHIVGGIGLVFHTVGELQGMLADGLVDQPGVQAVYAQCDGTVLASTHPEEHPVGTRLALEPGWLQVAPGQRRACVTIYRGHYCIVGCAAAHGYREFRRIPGAGDGVLALSFKALGAMQPDAQAAVQRRDTVVQPMAPQGGGGREMATFFVGSSLFALDVAHVLEAQPASAVAPVSAGRLPHCIGTLARRTQGQVSGYVWVFDLAHLLTGQAAQRSANNQVVVVQCAGRRIGLLVSELQGVHVFALESIVPMPGAAGALGQLVQSLVRANGGALLVPCLNPQALLDVLQSPTV